MEYEEIIARLRSLSDPGAVEGMKRYGITPRSAYGVSMPDMRKIAREAGTDHDLALRLWATDTRETRILASMIDDAGLLTGDQMESWAMEFDYWEICDQCCSNLFGNTPLAWHKATEWSAREEEYVKRAGFVLMARLAVADKKAGDESFEKLLPVIKGQSSDDRSMVRKAVNWALRQIGKRNLSLNRKAIETAEEIGRMDSRAARWIATDALRELRSEAVQRRVKGRTTQA